MENSTKFYQYVTLNVDSMTKIIPTCDNYLQELMFRLQIILYTQYNISIKYQRGEIMDLLQEYKDLYYKEIEFKESMSGKIGTSITFLTILSTGHMFMWDIMTNLNFIFHIIPLIFLAIEILSVFYTGLSMYNFYKSYFKYNYNLVSAQHIKEKLDKNNSLSSKFSSQEISKANYEMLCNTYLIYTNMNRNENMRKNKCQIRLNSSIIKAIITLILSYIMWIFIINRIQF